MLGNDHLIWKKFIISFQNISWNFVLTLHVVDFMLFCCVTFKKQFFLATHTLYTIKMDY
jgi:hypothetical protein